MAEWATLTEIEHCLSVSGASESTNDEFSNITADPTIIRNSLVNARLELSQYLIQKYDLSIISSAVEWVKWTTAWLASVDLMRRKGGVVPPGLQAKYDSILVFLDKVQNGPLIVPGLTPRTNGGIAMSNLTIDNGFGRAKVRRVNTISLPLTNSPLGTFGDRFDYGQTQ